jgi:hypothetical protein
MFEEWRRSRLEKKFPDLIFVWQSALVEIVPYKPADQDSVKFQIHTTFLTYRQLENLLKIVSEIFSETWDPRNKTGSVQIVALNNSTRDSANFIRSLLKSKLVIEVKFFLAISGAYSVRHFGLKRSLELLKAKSNMYMNSERERPFQYPDLTSKGLLILPSVDYNTIRSNHTSEEISHFFTSEIGLKLAAFLAARDRIELTFEEFFALPLEDLSLSHENPFTSANLLTALSIVENVSRKNLNKLTARHLINLVKDIGLISPHLWVMDEIIRRPRLDNEESFEASGVKCLDVLRDYVTHEEFLIIKEKMLTDDLELSLKAVSIFRPQRVRDPLGDLAISPLLSVLAEIAVTKGLHRYLEIMSILEEFFKTKGSNWYRLESDVLVSLVSLVSEALNDENDGINFRWVLTMRGHLPFDVGLSYGYRLQSILKHR